MGRSVDYLSNASRIYYVPFECEEGEEDFAWDDFEDNLTYGLKTKFKSLDKCKKWDGRETRIFLENNLAEVGISEYCGLVSISIRPKDGVESLGENWIDKISTNFEQVIKENCGETYRKVGSFSNGEGVFEKSL